ncbi:MAG: glucosaminidase domain-containing protein [Gammaproteobacteria bacterium]|nr:glucosaminidase domain-containing protein [Gammaproteobacteria bacterium]
MLSDGEIAGQKRKLELAFAGLISVALIALMVAITKFAPTYESATETALTPEPIVVFPDFASISNIEVKKQQFFDFLQDYVHYENGLISDLRLRLLSYAEIVDAGIALSGRERDWVIDLAITYSEGTEAVSDQALVNELLLKVDVIPASLVLAQAANESAWGTSRFALEGNNIFGQWCFEEGCGIIPNRRVEGATHEVKSFDSIKAAIEGYFLNINTHRLYAGFRQERARLRRLGQRLDPMLLVQGLDRYSQRGENYIDEVQTMIQQNDLRQRDRRWVEN